MQICHNCGYQNRPGVVFCENCGASLLVESSSMGTRALDDEFMPEDEEIDVETIHDAGVMDAEDFPSGGSLRLEISDAAAAIDVPYKKLIVLGRRDPSTGLTPEVDLTPYAGYRMGVSRRHAEIRHVTDDNSLEIWDLGSSNGTFLNEDRLKPHRAYRLRDGDMIRLGQLAIRLYFRKNGIPEESATE